MKNKTKITKDKLLLLVKKDFYLNVKSLGLFSLLFIGLALVYMLNAKDKTNYAFVIALICVGIIIIPTSYLIVILNAKKKYKEFPEQITYNFDFSKESFTVSSKDCNYTSKRELYTKVKRVDEEDHYVYIFMNPSGGYVVDKNGFDNVDELRKFLKKTKTWIKEQDEQPKKRKKH